MKARRRALLLPLPPAALLRPHAPSHPMHGHLAASSGASWWCCLVVGFVAGGSCSRAAQRWRRRCSSPPPPEQSSPAPPPRRRPQAALLRRGRGSSNARIKTLALLLRLPARTAHAALSQSRHPCPLPFPAHTDPPSQSSGTSPMSWLALTSASSPNCIAPSMCCSTCATDCSSERSRGTKRIML